MSMTDIETTDELKHQHGRDLRQRGVKIDDAIRGLTDDERMTLINRSLRKVDSTPSVSLGSRRRRRSRDRASDTTFAGKRDSRDMSSQGLIRTAIFSGIFAVS